MRALRLLIAAWSGIACATMPVAGEAYFQLAAPWRFSMSGNTIRFDEVSIAETVVPCTRTGARVKLQVRATSRPYQPPEAQRNLPLQPYQSAEAHGYLLAEHDVGKLGPAEFGCPYEAFNVTLPVTPPPPGTYYLSVFLFAFPSQGDTWCVDARYCLEDWRGFPDPVTFGGPAPSAPGR